MLALFLLRKNIGFFGKAFFLKERFVLKGNPDSFCFGLVVHSVYICNFSSVLICVYDIYLIGYLINIMLREP